LQERNRPQITVALPFVCQTKFLRHSAKSIWKHAKYDEKEAKKLNPKENKN